MCQEFARGTIPVPLEAIRMGSVRGWRPKSESWPKAERKGSSRPQPSRHAPQPAATGGNERRTPEEVLQGARARVAKLEAAISAVGDLDPTFPALQEALKQARRQAQVQPVEEPDQVFGVLHRAGEEACGESSQGGGGCQGQGRRRRDDIEFRVERITGGRAASCIPLGGSIEDGRAAATTNDARGFRSRVGAIEVHGCGAPARTRRVAVRVGALPHQSRRVAHGSQFGRCQHHLPIWC